MLTLRICCLSTSASTAVRPPLAAHSSNNSLLSASAILFASTPRRIHFLSPRCAVKQTKKQKALQKTSSSSQPSSNGSDGNLLWFLNPRSEEPKDRAEDGDGDGDGEGSKSALTGTVLAGLLLVGVVGGLATVGYLYKDQINDYLTQFSQLIEGYGPAGYAIFVAVYAGLEILALPAIPLTMSAGLLFGSVVGTILVSISGTLAASISFLIARYFARDRVLKLVEGNKKFLAIDKAIGENGFKVVALLRLSPLLPFSLGNYLYGLTSVDFVPYVLGSWLGMLPGTWAYVSAGAFGRALIEEESSVGLPGGNGQLLTLAAGLLVTGLVAAYVTRLAKDAVKDIEE